MIARYHGRPLLLAAALGTAPLAAQAPPPDRVIVVTLDGMRWQELLAGADRELLAGPDGGVSDTGYTRRRFWREAAGERRRALLPFLWDSIATAGIVLGDSAAGRMVRVTNGKWFSYPGYNELFSGKPDDRIDSNDKVPNPNVTVLERLAGRPGFRDSVAIFGSWDVFPSIFNTGRSKLPVNGHGPPFPTARSPRERFANQIASWMPDFWEGVRLDAPTMAAAYETLLTRKPRVLVVLLGETDEWAHARRYDLYLDAAYRADRFLAELWAAAQSLPEYRGRTTLLLSTDHGRGTGRHWTDHGREVPAAARIWMAALGPIAREMGGTERPTTQAEFARWIARAVGERWE